MLSPSLPILCCPLPDRVAPVFVQVVSPPLGWSPLSSLVVWSPNGDTGPSVVFEAVDVPYPRPLHFSHIADCDGSFLKMQLTKNNRVGHHPNVKIGITNNAYLVRQS